MTTPEDIEALRRKLEQPSDEPNDYSLIEQIVKIVDEFATEYEDTRSAYDWVLNLAEPPVSVEYTAHEWNLLHDIVTAAEKHYGHPMWPEHWDVVLDEMDEIGDAAND